MEFIKVDNTMKDVIKMLKYRDEMKDTVEKLKLKVIISLRNFAPIFPTYKMKYRVTFQRDVDQLSRQISNMPVPTLLKDCKENTTSKQLPIHHER